ncbi:phospholipid phosphatase 2-like [Saccostrea echinata]|uniref:phospholipid phosphatase 2-like n=1 Tax=Saccostrea echinata TaxID=191078 RepID=UPI002A81FA76|nr:phospholipid phosphatase 2-like [Saccostrea echinata]
MLSAVDATDIGSCSKRKIIITLIDICIVGLAAVPLLIFKVSVTPYTRGFYCNDDSIKYPYKSSTITSTALYTIGFVINIVLILLFEFIRYQFGSSYRATNGGPAAESTTSYTDSTIQTGRSTRRKIFQYFYNVYRVLLPFVFGAVVEHLTTDIGKYSIGRLRPHFLSVCQPDPAKYNCVTGYITDDVCTGDQSLIREARLSFPSGHASFSTYTMIFAMLYVQARLRWRIVYLLRPLIQLILFYLAFYTCLSRVSDYKHHWSDVLAGAIIGVVTAILVVFKVSNLFEIEPKDVNSGTPVIQNMVVQTPEHRTMGLQHFTETVGPGPKGKQHNTHIMTKGYSNSQFVPDEYDDRYYVPKARHRNGVAQSYRENEVGVRAEGRIATQVYYIDAGSSHHSDSEGNATFSKMTTQL